VPEALDDRVDERGDFARVRDIGDVQGRFAAGLLDERHRLLRLRPRRACIHHDGGAACGERARDGAADVARAARDKRDFARELLSWRHSNIACQCTLPSGLSPAAMWQAAERR
jgi:hypothetical protein